LVCDATLKAAAGGEAEAWDTIVIAFSSVVWTAAASILRDSAHVRSVCRITWLRCLDHLDQVDADSIGSWLTSTARREARRQALLAGCAGFGAHSATA
jgi:DNA-directed RNA polymerase specialized sigma24 family protein